ncbi:hypothetical protein TNCV_412171 [Trichonephila clavipes]|uniref:Uncharacterized protein n=1 Tax=Trichonephila clavipes TaxID=2585209 RepID=A0A8X6S2U7_TRICX|nr:hypothetical protein TNCV_412171 [Trichonephila clavipes]
MITNFFIPELNNHDVKDLWFQQEGATFHAARATVDLLKDTYVNSLVYADKPQTLDHLEDNIRHVIADIRPQMLEKVIENLTSRLDYIRASCGSHMPEIIFKIKKVWKISEDIAPLRTSKRVTKSDTDIGRHLMMSSRDEAHFWLNGYVNKQNCRIWSEANPQVYVETPLHPEKLTAWCSLWAGLILLQKR